MELVWKWNKIWDCIEINSFQSVFVQIEQASNMKVFPSVKVDLNMI